MRDEGDLIKTVLHSHVTTKSRASLSDNSENNFFKDINDSSGEESAENL